MRNNRPVQFCGESLEMHNFLPFPITLRLVQVVDTRRPFYSKYGIVLDSFDFPLFRLFHFWSKRIKNLKILQNTKMVANPRKSLGTKISPRDLYGLQFWNPRNCKGAWKFLGVVDRQRYWRKLTAKTGKNSHTGWKTGQACGSQNGE